MRRTVFFVTAALLALPLGATAADCGALSALSLAGTTITKAAVVPAGPFKVEAPGPQPGQVPEFCRVEGVLRPSADSEIRFEVWLPTAGWTGKLQGIGNGGFAGSISYAGLAEAARHNYAAVSTDTGHQGGGTDASWGRGHPEKVIDFGYRAVHEMTVKGKAITEAFYGKAPARSYFSSCSNGGRQALMEAQRFPADYDGIIAGAPANNWTHLLSSGSDDVRATVGTAGAYIRQQQLPAIQAAVLKACDAADRVEDGVLENPPQCHWKPDELLCTGAPTDACLTQPQLTALKKIYDGMRNSKGQLLYPGYSPGGEADRAGWGPWITGSAPQLSLLFLFSTNYYRHIVYGDPQWDFHTFDVDRDLPIAVQRTSSILDSTNPDLKPFQSRGGKLILYHGWSDAAIPAQSTIDYYQSVVRKMGEPATAGFVRLYMVPGMQHCGGGDGTDSFGQFGVPRGDAHHDVAAALERWVEQGEAPAEIIAAKVSAGNTTRTRPLCVYPRIARYKGTGSSDDAANFECALPAVK